MLRISISEPVANSATLRLEGQIAGPWTEELSAACDHELKAGLIVTLDLENVSMIDRPALALLSSLSHRAVKLARCSPFHEEQIKRVAAPDEDTNNHVQ